MNEKGYKKRLDFQQKMIARQSKQIEDLELQIGKLKLEIEEKNKVINSVALLKEELTQNVAESKNYADRSKKLVQELKQMKKIMNKEVYKNRWWLIKLLLK
jgi:hypothetical protein